MSALTMQKDNAINDCDDQVLFRTFVTDAGKQIGVATLNIEKALNALNLNMVQALTAQLNTWRHDDNIVAVMLDGAGEKAFCAGGDVRAIYQASVKSPGEITDTATEFFKQEYELDYLLHCFGKPLLVWGDGIVMGGGLGLMVGASHRVVTERSRIAMPEVTIGLYPDVGGSYFLNRMPGKSGLFLGMTAYNMSGADALYVGIGNHYLNHDDKQTLLAALCNLAWTDSSIDNHQVLDNLLELMNLDVNAPLAKSQLEQEQQLIDRLMAGSLEEIISRVTALDATILAERPWLAKALKTLLAGSPISLNLVYLQSKLNDILGKELSLAECFKLELGLSVNCCAKADFSEGVRALLIDKDRNPQWLFTDIASIPQGYAQDLLQSPWDEGHHPLNDMD